MFVGNRFLWAGVGIPVGTYLEEGFQTALRFGSAPHPYGDKGAENR